MKLFLEYGRNTYNERNVLQTIGILDEARL